MKKLYKGVSRWFTTGCMNAHENEFDKAKIKFTFNLLSFLFVVGIVYSLNEYFTGSLLVTGLYMLIVPIAIALAFSIRLFHDIRLTNWLMVSLFILYYLANILLWNGKITITVGLWAFIMILFSFMTLSRKQSLLFTTVLFVISLSFLSLNYFGAEILHVSSNQKIGNPIMFTLPFLVLFYMLSELHRQNKRAENKLKCMVEQIEGSNSELRFTLDKTREMKLRLEESERKFRLISQNSRDMIALHKVDGTYTYISPSVKVLLGYDPSELWGTSPYELFHPDDKEKIIKESHKKAVDGELNNTVQYRVRKKNGEYTWFETITTPIKNSQGKVYKLQTASRDISLQKKIEKELFSVAKFPEENPFPIFRLNRQGSIIYDNKKDQEVTNFFRNEFMLKHRRLFDELFERKEIVEMEFQINDRIFSIVFTPMHELEYMNVYTRDVTARTKAQQELEVTYTRINELINNLEDGILMENQDRTILFTNQNFCDIFQIDAQPKELIGQDCSLITMKTKDLFGNEQDFIKRLNDLIQKKEKVLGEELQLSNGKIYERDFIPVFVNQVHIGNLWHYREITDQKLHEDELKEAKELAEKASLAKAQFLSTMSHEIRTPMNAVIGLTNILLDEDPKPDQVENLKTLKFSGENLLALINDILDFSKIEAGKIEFERVSFNLHTLLESIKKSHEPRARQKNISLNLRLDTDLPKNIVGDPVRLSQILNNLVSNAIKFTHAGRVILDITQLEKKENVVALGFSVSDTGIGIDQEKQDMIFESFSQASSDTTRKYGGTGLGLAITKRLLDLHGSRIEIESEPGKGSKFFFELSFEIGDELDMGNQGISPVLNQLKGTKLLLVEDNYINQMIAKKFLVKWEFEVDVANNGQEALDMIRDGDYHLVLMDLQMPVLDGYQATQKIRELDDHKKDIPIIALTASAMMEIQEKVYAVGMNDFVLKPFKPDELFSKIQKHLSYLVSN